MTTLPPHLAKFFDSKGNLNADAATRVAAGRKEQAKKAQALEAHAAWLEKYKTATR